ncbi:MAG: amino acid adenylation domain-containing protein, partial [Pseudomonadota bacterium]
DDLAYIIYTSGSTGMPKGVPITHGGLANFINAMQAAPGFDTTDILLAVTTVAFDIAALELFVPLTVGACVVLSGSDEARDAEALADLIEAYDVNVMQASPSTWRLLIASGWPGRSELRMLCGGEALDPSLASALLERGGVLWNLYGPTETTIWSAALAVDPTMAAGDRIPIGGPIANTQLRVVDRHQRPVPVGVAGELLIGGAGVSPGYWERPALTAERFLAAAAGEHSRGASVLYRTGDRVRWRADGTLQFLGRDDLQIKLRGHRIELGEIEAVLNAHEAVEQAAVSVHKDRHGDSRLVAFVVTRSQTDDRRLRAALRERLPEPMVPARIERLDALPMTLNGKLDREALAGISVAQDDEGNADRNDGAADTVRTPATELVASAWCEVLAIGRVSARDNFFELGGHSLTAIRLATRLGLLLGRDVPLRLLFDHPRFDEQVAALERLTSEVQLDPIPLLARDGRPIPLSPAQRRQWLLAGLMPDNPMYGIPTAVRLEGRVEVPALRDSLERLTLRHETLRTEFRERDGTPYAFINDAPTVTLNEVDLNGSATTIDAWLRAEAARPIALDRAPLWRVSLITDVDGSQVLTVVMHHILADGWSLGVFVRELAASYAAWPDPAPLPPLPVQYADFAAWSDAAEHGPSLDYWVQALADLAPELSLPTDFPHPAEPSYVGATQHFTVDGVTRDRLIALGRREGSTLFMTLLSAFALLLHKLTGESDLAIGTPVANRQHPDLEQLIGLFVNTLVLRLRLDGNPTLSELMARTRATALAAYQHQQAPFEAVLDGLEIPRSRSRTPLFQVLFTLQNAPFDAAPAGDLTWTPMALDSATSKFDLSLAVTERDEGLEAAIEYRSELFRPTTIARFAELYCDLLAALPDAAERPLATISPLSFARREELDSWRRQEAPPAPEAAVHELFQQQAAATPKAVALVQDDREWTYQQLDVFANRLAHELRDAGVGAETPVGVWIQLTPETIGAILAILKAGGVYVPLDPALSDARLSQLCTSAGVERVVAASSMDGPEGRLGTVETLGLDQRGDALARQPAVPPDRRVRADRLAYVMFTSGSTGEPKGVATPHRGITRLVRQSAFARFDSDEVFLLAAPLSFDASTLELWGALLNGARLVLPPATATGVQSLDDLGTLVEQHGVSTLWLTAGLFQLMIDTQPERLTSLRQLLAGGDALSVEHLKRAHAALPRTQLINGYGPTEGTTFTCCHRFDAAELEPESALAAAPIGKPIAHTDIYVLDGDMERVPVGGIGELYLGGRGLARGYIDQPALTAERFLPNPHFDPRRDRADDTSLTLYRTGDRVRWRDDGVLEFLGRVDEQVKIRGFRVEPAEIEHALHAHPAVAQAVVIPIGEGAVERRLAAYLVPADALDSHAGKLPDATALRRFLLERLPVQLMPSAYVWLPALPLTANGKVDRGALPEPEWDAQGKDAGDAGNEVERRLLSIWSDLLPASVLDRHSNFFDAGGDSIIALQIVSRAARQGLEITPAQLFQHQSVVELAAVAVRLEDSTGPVAATGDAPLTPIQRWFFSQQPPVPAHFNQAVLLRIPSQLEPARLEKALTQVTSWHDAFRLRFLPDPEAPGGWRQSYAEPGQSALKLEHHILSVGSASERRQLIERHADRLHGSLELDTGPLLRAALFEDAACRDGDSTRLLLVAHHLIIDGVSWRILLDDLLEAYRDLDALPPRPTASYQAWSEALCSREALAKASLAHWQAEAARAELRLPLDAAPATARAGNQVTLETALDAQATQLLLQTVPRSSGYEVQDLLLTALASTLLRWCDGRMPTIDIEHHGRDASALDIHLDVSRTIGWFTAIYPFTPALELSQKPAEQLEIVSEGLRSLPAHGLGHGMLCYLGGQESLAVRAPVGFNYLGVLDDTGAATGGIRRLPVPGRLQAAANPRAHLLAINAFVSGECLTVQWIHDRDLHTDATVARLAAELIDALRALIDTHARGAGADPSASAFELAGLDADGLSDLLQQVSFGKDP